MRDSTIFYRSFYEAIKTLPEVNQLEVYNAIFEYSLNNKEPKLQGISNTIFTLIKPQLEANNKRFANGKKGGRPKNDNQNETEIKPKDNQNETETEANNNNNVNNNNNDNVNDNLKEQFNNKKNEFLKRFESIKNTVSWESIKISLNSIVNQKLNYDLMIDDFIIFLISNEKIFKKDNDLAQYFSNHYKLKKLDKYFIIENNNDIDFDKFLTMYNQTFKRKQTILTAEEKKAITIAVDKYPTKVEINRAILKMSQENYHKETDTNGLISFKSFVDIKYLFKLDNIHKFSSM